MNLPTDLFTSSPEETERLGASLAEYLLSDGSLPRFIALWGDLGVGKTAFTRGFTSYISPASAVRSPTFTLVNEYLKGKVPVFHFDMYRIDSEDDLYSMGFYDYADRGGFMIVEWSEKIPFALPDERINVTIEKCPERSTSERHITITG